MATKRTDKPAASSEKSASSKPAKAQPAVEEAAPPAEALDLTQTLNRKERRNMMKFGKFLVGVNMARYARTRAVVGFAEADKQEGWRLFRIAGGEEVSLQAITEGVPLEGERAISIEKLQALDAFENKWIPGAERIIKRFAKDEQKRFLEIFFFNLQQQPLGEGLLVSVPLLIQRVRELATSEFTTAPKVASELSRRGLNAAKMAEMEAILASLKTPTAAAPDASALNRAQRAQREAYEDLVLWWNDWSETFRPELSRQDQIALGLASPRKSEAAEADEDGEDGEDGEDEGGEGDPTV